MEWWYSVTAENPLKSKRWNHGTAENPLNSKRRNHGKSAEIVKDGMAEYHRKS